jgi:glycosyltransferase involved in cell wall biosynthesis
VALARFELPVVAGRVRGNEIWRRACNSALTVPDSAGKKVAAAILEDHFFGQAGRGDVQLPPCSIAICTRDRADDLHRCLSSIAPLICDSVEVMVIDNDPPDNRTRDVAALFPVRYFRQARRCVNWARARAIRLARHEVVLYVDDDVAIDGRRWLDEMRRPFLDPHVGAVTGAVEPLELSTEGQYLHEVHSSFYRGFARKVHHLQKTPPAAAGLVGAGASMGVRRSTALEYSIFDAELDGGSAAKSGGDVYGLYRILHAGYQIVYAPGALAFHRHRKTYDDLERMLYGYSVGGYCVLLSAFIRERDLDALIIGAIWFRQYHLAELWKTLTRAQGARPLGLILKEIRGAFDAPLAFWKCRRRERRLCLLDDEPLLEQAL